MKVLPLYLDLQTCSEHFFLHLLYLPQNCFVNSKCNLRKGPVLYGNVVLCSFISCLLLCLLIF